MKQRAARLLDRFLLAALSRRLRVDGIAWDFATAVNDELLSVMHGGIERDKRQIALLAAERMRSEAFRQYERFSADQHPLQ